MSILVHETFDLIRSVTYWNYSSFTISYSVTFDDIKEGFLDKEWKFFHLLGKELDDFHLKDQLM